MGRPQLVGDTTLPREGQSQREAHKPEYQRRETCLRGCSIANIPTGGIPPVHGWEEVKHSAHTPASTDPDRTAAPDRHDPESDRENSIPDCPSVNLVAIGPTADSPESDTTRTERRRGLGSSRFGVGSRGRDPRTFPADGYDGRAARARVEPMTVWPLRDGRYLVDTGGGSYVVDAARAVCGCPDSALRGARCKHVRRVALEIAAGFVPAPDRDKRVCAVCGGAAFVGRDARGPALCARHDPGTVVADRETGKRLVIVGLTGERADEARTSEGRVVADYDTNTAYGRHEPAVAARYVDPSSAFRDGRDRPDTTVEGRQYLFPASRLRPVDDPAAAGSAAGSPGEDAEPSAGAR